MQESVEQRLVGHLRVKIFADEPALGAAAAAHTAEVIRARVAEQGAARLVMATGNSQLAFVRALRDQPAVPWEAVTVFHLDEYVGITAGHPASFRRWILENVTAPFRPGRVHYLDGDAASVPDECRRYQELLRAEPLDLICLGIGENGHIAFNEPYAADFADPDWVRVIKLDEQSRKQQVREGHFPTLEQVPDRAISLSVPALLAPATIQVVVPELRKADAVRAALTDQVSPACPATILREQRHATLFLDRDSASLLDRRADPSRASARR